MNKSIISYLPTENFSAALTTLQQDVGFTEIKWKLLNILLWTIGSVIAAVIIYGKRSFDK